MIDSLKRNWFAIVFSIAAALRLYAIDAAPLWYDENFSLTLARLPFDKMIQATAADVHPPLWYLIGWMLYHAAPDLPAWALRLPSAAFSLLALYLLDQLCERMHLPARVRVIAVCLMAFLPFQIWYAQEGRMYAMLEMLVLAALLAGLAKRWWLFTFAVIALPYTQNYGVLYAVVIAAALYIHDRRDWQYILLAGIVSMLAFAPWAYIVQQQMTLIAGRYWIMDAGAGAVLNAIYKQFWASSMLEAGVITSHVVTFAALILGTLYTARSKHPHTALILGMAYMPVLLSWVVSLTWQPILLFRPLIGISPFLYILAAWTFDVPAFRQTRAQLLTAAFVVPVFMFGMAGYYQNIAAMKGEGAVSSMLNALAYVRANWQAGDVIYHTDDGSAVNLLPYASDLPQYKMPACAEEVTGYAPVLGSLSNPTRIAMGMEVRDLADVPHTRAWVFAPRSPLHPKCYEAQIAAIAPEGKQLITVDNNAFIASGVWLFEQ
jgi:uncharacterized membrane protein